MASDARHHHELLGVPVSLPDNMFAILRTEMPAAAQVRRQLHRQPDLSGHEAPTLVTLLAELPAVAQCQTLPGNAAIFRIGASGPAVGIRAEMDALPIEERTGVDWASTNGAMHACGHDVHMAALLAVIRTLSTLTDLPAPVVGILQPREEARPSGALELVESGALNDHHVQAIIGAHVQPALNSTAVACEAGVVNAASDEFVITLHGDSAHGAYPHHARDPLLAASSFVVTCQQIVSRNTDPTDSAVVSIGSLRGGGGGNIIPGEAVVEGTIRSMSSHQRAMIRARINEVADGVALAHGCAADVVIHTAEPPLVNDSGLAQHAADILRLSGVAMTSFRSYGADDFAYYGSIAPSLMMFVGTPQSDGHGLHTDRYLPDDDALWRVASSMLAGYLAGARCIDETSC